MSASVVPPPPPEAPPPLPEEPPLPTTPPPPANGAQQHIAMQQAQYFQVPAGNAAYPYAQQPMYQYPLQQPYNQAYTPYASYPPCSSWQATTAQHVYEGGAGYTPYYPAQQYPATYAPAHVAQHPWASAGAVTAPSATAAPPSLSSVATGTISFSLNGATKSTTHTLAQVSHKPAQLPPAPAQGTASTKQSPQSLKEWIRRALQKYESRDNDPLLKETMKRILEDKKAQGVLYTHDWDREPLPTLPPVPVPTETVRSPPGHAVDAQMDSPSHDSRHKGWASRKLDRGPPPSESSFTISKRKRKVKQARDRAARFAAAVEAPICAPESLWDPKIIIKGTCQSIEKSFLRLNGVPKSEEVRPEPVLIRALDRIITMIAGGEKDFMYIWNQLKAIRQDLTVQHIRNANTVRTEEAFARSALEHSDQQEFRKCVSTLQAMYDEQLPGCRAEFGAYQLLLYICIEQKDRALSFSRAVLQLVAQGVWDTPEVQHAMSVFHALSSCNYVRFWNLYTTAPNCGRLVMDWGVRKLRFEALKGLAMSYRTVPLEMCAKVLGFVLQATGEITERSKPLPGVTSVHCVGAEVPAQSDAERQQRCAECLRAHGGIVIETGGAVLLDAKASANKIVMPKQEQTSARAVGNSHLDCAAFLKDVPTDRNSIFRVL